MSEWMIEAFGCVRVQGVDRPEMRCFSFHRAEPLIILL